MSDGDALRTWREGLGLSRKEVADEAGVTISAVASVESGRGSRDKAAAERIRRCLERQLSPSKQEEGARTPRAFSQGAALKAKDDWEICLEWRGLSPESRFTVLDEEGVFVFIRHVTAPKGEWVDCFGGTRHEKKFRAFRPERVVMGVTLTREEDTDGVVL